MESCNKLFQFLIDQYNQSFVIPDLQEEVVIQMVSCKKDMLDFFCTLWLHIPLNYVKGIKKVYLTKTMCTVKRYWLFEYFETNPAG